MATSTIFIKNLIRKKYIFVALELLVHWSTSTSSRRWLWCCRHVILRMLFLSQFSPTYLGYTLPFHSSYSIFIVIDALLGGSMSSKKSIHVLFVTVAFLFGLGSWVELQSGLMNILLERVFVLMGWWGRMVTGRLLRLDWHLALLLEISPDWGRDCR